jgi:integrase
VSPGFGDLWHGQRHIARLGLPAQRFHDLRHAFATLAIESGADLHEVARWLGHATIRTTADVYGHFTDAMAQQLAGRMDKVLSSAG